MADYSDDDIKFNIGALYPANAITADFQRLEPILGPDEMRTRFLFGIPLVSQITDPTTGKRQVMNDTQVKDIIDGAIQKIEQDLYIDIYAVERRERYPFDGPEFLSFGYIKAEHCPIYALINMTITAPNNANIYQVPLSWVSSAYFLKGQINVVPWLANSQTISGFTPTGADSGAFFMSILGTNMQMPAYWQIEYTSGFPDGLVPRVVNDLIGATAAIDILSMLGATYARVSGQSIGIDSLSQSISGPGPNIFATRIADLQLQRERYIGKIKAMFGKKVFAGTI